MKHNTLRKDGDAQMESQRWQAAQAGRDAARETLIKNTLERAADLIKAGRYADARRVVELNLGWEAR